MSGADQDEAILRLVKQRGEAKKRKVLLENELRTAGQFLWEIGGALKMLRAGGSFHETPEYVLPQIDKSASEICNLERIRAMLQELKDLEANLKYLNRSASDLGID